MKSSFSGEFIASVNDSWEGNDPPLMTKEEVGLLVRLIEERSDKIKVAVELGCYSGKTSILLAAALPDQAQLYCVDNFCINGSYVRDHVVEDLFPKYPNITLIEKTTRQAAVYFQLPIDLLIVDADHQDHSMIEDLQDWLPKVKPGSVVAFHDYFNPDFPSVARRVEEFTQGWTFLGQADTLMVKQAPL